MSNQFVIELGQYIKNWYPHLNPRERMSMYNEVYTLKKMLECVQPTWKNDFDDVMYVYEMSFKSMRGAEFVENLKKQYHESVSV